MYWIWLYKAFNWRTIALSLTTPLLPSCSGRRAHWGLCTCTENGRRSWLKAPRYDTQKCNVQWLTLNLSHRHTLITVPFIHTHTQSAPAEEEWCEQETSICRPRGVHRPQGQLQEREKTQISSIHWRRLCTNRKQQGDVCVCLAGGSVDVNDSMWEQLTPSSCGSTYSSSPILDREWMALASTGRYIHTHTPHITITSYRILMFRFKYGLKKEEMFATFYVSSGHDAVHLYKLVRCYFSVKLANYAKS